MTKQERAARKRETQREIAFIYSQRACGGPAREEDLRRYKRELAELEATPADD